MLRVGVFPADEGGCGHYRVNWPWAEVARQFSDELEIIHADDIPNEIVLAWSGGPFDDSPTEYHVPTKIMSMPDFDVMVFQRPLHAKYAPYFELLRERGIIVIVDLDDNFDRIDPRNVAWYASEPHWMSEHEARQVARLFGTVTVTRKSSDGRWVYTPAHMGSIHRKNIRAALKHTDLLIASTPSLAAHYAGLADQTIVIENCVNDWYLGLGDAQLANEVPIVGWTGSVMTHPHDLQQMGPALTRLRRKGIEFVWRIVGTGVGVGDASSLEPDEATTTWVSLEQYPREYAKLDIAVCPLDLSHFNDAKSWLKPLEAAAVGVVPIMSASSEYERIHARGVGLIAHKPREWERHLQHLIKNEGQRDELRAQGLEVAREMTYQKQAWRWVEALNVALAHRTASVS